MYLWNDPRLYLYCFSERGLTNSVTNLVTLDDLEWRNSPNRRVISPSLVAKWLKMHRYFPQRKYRPKNLVFFRDISFITISAGVTTSESVKVRHSPFASENLTNNQP